MYQISANLVHRELRNATFEEEKMPTSIIMPDSAHESHDSDLAPKISEIEATRRLFDQVITTTTAGLRSQGNDHSTRTRCLTYRLSRATGCAKWAETWVGLTWISLFHHLAQPLQPNSHQPKQSRADSGTLEIQVNKTQSQLTWDTLFRAAYTQYFL